MALSTFESIWNEIMAVCPTAGPDRAKIWTRDAFREVAEAGPWSWLLGRTHIHIPAIYNTGTFDATAGSPILSGNGTAWTTAMIGRQFKYGSYIYDIIDVDASSQTLTLDEDWAEDTTAGSYVIALIYYIPPSDFHYWRSVVDTTGRLQLWTNLDMAELDAYDPQRTYGSSPCALVYVDTSSDYAGEVGPVVHAAGTAAVDAVSGGTYTGADDAIYTIEITTTGAVGASDFQWKKNDDTPVTGVATSSTAITLQEGVTVRFPTGTYTDGAIFVFHVRPIPTPGLPRYEIYPHQSNTAPILLPAWYYKRPADPEDANGVLPRYIRGDVVKEGALAKCAWWPGSHDKPNPYAGIARAKQHQDDFRAAIDRMATQDNEVVDQRVIREILLPFAQLPWAALGDGIDQLHDFRGFASY